MRPIVILPHDKVPSATEFTLLDGHTPDWPIGTKNDRNGIPRTFGLDAHQIGTVMPVSAALTTEWQTDAMLTPYRVHGISSHHPRVDKPGRDWLRILGIPVWFEWIILDFDNPGHEAWKTHEESVIFLERLAAQELTSTAYRWATRSGARVMWPIDDPIDISDDDNRILVEGHMRGLIHVLSEAGLQADEATVNVGRVQRPPHTYRMTPFGRRMQHRPMHIDSAEPIAFFNVAPFHDSRHRSMEEVIAEREHQEQLRVEIRARMDSLDIDDADKLHRADAYLDEMSICISGVDGNINATRAARVLIESFDLDHDECATVMNDSSWNARCAPPWSFSELLEITRVSEAWVYRNGRLRGVKLLEDRERDDDVAGRAVKLMADPVLQMAETVALARFRQSPDDDVPYGGLAQIAAPAPPARLSEDAAPAGLTSPCTEDSDHSSLPSGDDQKHPFDSLIPCADRLNYNRARHLSHTTDLIQGEVRPQFTSIWKVRESAKIAGNAIVDTDLPPAEKRPGWELINYSGEMLCCCDPRQKEVIEHVERRETSEAEVKERKRAGWRCKHAHFCPRCAQTLGAILGREMTSAMNTHGLVAGAVTYHVRAASPLAVKQRVTEFVKKMDVVTQRRARVAIPSVTHSAWGDEFVIPITFVFLARAWCDIDWLQRRLLRWDPPPWSDCADPRVFRIEAEDAAAICINTHNGIPEWIGDADRMAEAYSALKGFNRRRLNRAALDLWKSEDPDEEEESPNEARHDELHFKWDALREMSDERDWGRCWAYLNTFRRLHYQHEKVTALPEPVLICSGIRITAEAAISAISALSNRLYRHDQDGFTTKLTSGLDLWDIEEACISRSIHAIELDRVEIDATKRFIEWSKERRRA